MAHKKSGPGCCDCEGPYTFVVQISDCGGGLEDGAKVTCTDKKGFNGSCEVCSMYTPGCKSGGTQSRCVINVPGPGTYYFSASGGKGGPNTMPAEGSCEWTQDYPEGYSGPVFTGCCYGGENPAKYCVTPVGCTGWFGGEINPYSYDIKVKIGGKDAVFYSPPSSGIYYGDNLGYWCSCVEVDQEFTVEVSDPNGRFKAYTETHAANVPFLFRGACVTSGGPQPITGIDQLNLVQLDVSDTYACACSHSTVDQNGRLIRLGCNIPIKKQLHVAVPCGQGPAGPLVFNNPDPAIPVGWRAGWTAIDSVMHAGVNVFRVWQFPYQGFGVDPCAYLCVRWSFDPTFPPRPVNAWNNSACFVATGTMEDPILGGRTWLKCAPGFIATFYAYIYETGFEACDIAGFDGCYNPDDPFIPVPIIVTITE